MLQKILIVCLCAFCLPAVAVQAAANNSEAALSGNLAEMSKFHLPPGHLQKLHNGSSIITVQSTGTERYVLKIRVLASSVNDFAGRSGVAEATANLLAGGRDGVQKQLENYGASLEISAPYGSYATEFSVAGPVEAFSPIARRLLLAVTQPHFSAADLQEWKRTRLARLQEEKTSPRYLADAALSEVLYEDARRNIGPEEQSLAQMTIADVKEFYRRFYGPCRTYVGVISPEASPAIEAKLRKFLASWRAGCSSAAPVTLADHIFLKRSIYVVDDPQIKQAYMVLAKPAISRLSPDYAVCLVLNRILGEGPGSRLFHSIRQTRGYTYDIRSSFTALKYLHHVSIAAALAPERIGDVLELISREVESLRNVPPTVEEVNTAKAAIIGGLALDLESREVILGMIMNQYLYGWSGNYEQQHIRDLLAVTPEAVQLAARKYLDTSRMQVILVGNKNTLQRFLNKTTSATTSKAGDSL